MYEEVLPFPAGYKTSFLCPQPEDANFDRTFMVYLTSHSATRRALNQTVASCWQGNYSTPGAQSTLSNSLQPPTPSQQRTAWNTNPQRNAMGSSKFRNTPYPLATPSIGTNYYHQAESAVFQGPDLSQQYFNSPYDSPFQAVSFDGRRMSLPAGFCRSCLSTSGGASPRMPRHLSSDTLSSQNSYATSDNRYHYHQSPGASHNSPPTIGYSAMPAPWQALTEPLSTELPAGYQGLVAKDSSEATFEFSSPWDQSFNTGSQR